jgi:hypothetical protein
MHKPVPVKRKIGLQCTVRKMMFIISWDAQGIVMEYLEGGKKVKESCNMPSVAQRVPGGLGSQIS